MPEPILRATNLTKKYGRTTALQQLNLSIAPGEVVGLLGPNGSGKTTALRLFLGFLRATAGTVQVVGFDCWKDSVKVRSNVTYLPGELRLYENMTGRQLVVFLNKLRGVSSNDVDALAKRLDINPDLPLTQLSSGMKRKVALLSVLVPKVPLLILDEPTNTLDPTMRDEFLEQIRLAKRDGKAVLFSSHVLAEVEAVCDRVVMLRKGMLVHEQDIATLQKGRTVRATLTGAVLDAPPSGGTLTITGNQLKLDYLGDLPPLLSWLQQQPISELHIEPSSLAPIYQKFFQPAGATR
jgi:ABC-2 type transport system ATP-binding protein